MRWNQKRTDEAVHRAKLMRDGGTSIRQIAKDFGVSTSTIEKWLCPARAALYRDRCRQYKVANRGKINDANNRRNATPEGWCVIAVGRSRTRAKKQGLPFSLTASDVINALPHDLRCPVLGVPLQFGQGTSQNNPSLDRIIPSLGYVPGNIAIISFRANTMKQDATADEVRALLDYIESRTTDLKLIAG